MSSRTDFIGRTDAKVLEFCTPFSAKITATPTAFGVTAAIATLVASKLSTFSAALSAAKDPLTRGPATILAKDNARKDLVSYVRSVAKQIQGTMTVTNAQRQELGLTIPAPHTPAVPPDQGPVMKVRQRNGTMVRLEFTELGADGRAKPKGCDGVRIYSYIGATAPESIDDWVFQGTSSKTFADVELPPSTPPGTQVWFTSQWYTRRGETSPGSAPICTNIAGGAVDLAA